VCPAASSRPAIVLNYQLSTEKESNGEDDSSEVPSEELGRHQGQVEAAYCLVEDRIGRNQHLERHALDLPDADRRVHSRARSGAWAQARAAFLWQIPHVLEVAETSSSCRRRASIGFKTEGLAEAFASISPIKDFTGNLILEFGEHSLGEPKYSIEECRERDMTYSAPLRVRVRLITAESGEIKGHPRPRDLHGRFPAHDRQGHLS